MFFISPRKLPLPECWVWPRDWRPVSGGVGFRSLVVVVVVALLLLSLPSAAWVLPAPVTLLMVPLIESIS